MNERHAPLGSLLASAKRLTSRELKARTTQRKTTAVVGWQEEAWDMYDLVGEQRYLATTLAGRMGKARLYIGKMSDDPLGDPEGVEDPRINAVLDSFGKSTAGRGQMIERMAVNLFMTGDGWLAGIPEHVMKRNDPEWEMPEDYDEDNVPLSKFTWRMFSTSEVSTTAGSDSKVVLQIDEFEKLNVDADEVYLIRVWRPHPRRWWEADSSTRASLPVLREMVGLTLHISAQVESRLAGAGLLIVPASAQKAFQAAAGRPEDSTSDEFTEALMEAMITPIENRGSASAIVPLVVTVPDEAVSKFEHMTFNTPLEGAAQGMRDDAIRRLALGQDAPPEVLLGTAGMNHWGGWLVQDEVVSTHIEPPLALICDAITTQYLWPVLESLGIEDHESYVVWYDTSKLTIKPNRSAEAMTLHEKGVISDDSLRREAGFDEGDAPDSEDPAKEILLELVRSNPGLLRSSSLQEMVETLQKIIDGKILTPADAVQEDPDALEEGAGSPGPETTEPPPGNLPETSQGDAEPSPALAVTQEQVKQLVWEALWENGWSENAKDHMNAKGLA